jgi:hypothetical protein
MSAKLKLACLVATLVFGGAASNASEESESRREHRASKDDYTRGKNVEWVNGRMCGCADVRQG